MKKQILRTTTVAAMLALTAVGCAAIASTVERGDDDAREIAMVTSAPVSLLQAISAAEGHTNGRAVEAGAEDEDGNVLYEVVTLAGSTVSRLQIDPQTGKVLAEKQAGLLDRLLDDGDADEFVGATQPSVTLSSAVAAAELVTGGLAIEAEFEGDDGVAAYEVEVTASDGVRKVVVDGASGDVVTAREFDDD